MSLLKEIVKSAAVKQMVESAAAGATSAGAIAGVRAPLMKKPRRRNMTPGVKFEQQEEKIDWNKEVDEFNKRRKENDRRGSGKSRMNKLRARRPDLRGSSVFNMKFEQQEEKKEIDWNKELRDFRERDRRSTPNRRKTRLTGNRRMSGPTGSTFGLRFESYEPTLADLVLHYEEILDTDGWETTELTVNDEHPELAEKIMSELQRRQSRRANAWRSMREGVGDEKFDPADVISKLRAAEEKADNEENTRGFALEDEDGNIVKVYVASEEAEEFEQALGAALAGEDEDDDEENTSLEIAEVLFNLKDRFTIVDVEWPEVEEDEEDMATDAGNVGDAEEDLDADIEGESDELDVDIDAEGEGGDLDAELDAEGGDMEMDAEGGAVGGGEMGALQAMIDLLKAQAEAQKAEAQAREAEANAEEAKYNAGAAAAKVEQEEQVLDMEAYYDKKKQADKEAKKLQKLAKWKHETAQSKSVSSVDEEQEVFGALDGDEIPGNKFEEPGPDENRDHRMQPGEFIKYMLMNARRNP